MAETNYISAIKVFGGKVYSIKDTDARVRMTEIDYASLKSLRDNSKLIPGMQYRITDYHTTTIQEDTKSAGHQFDIIVTADSNNKLNEVARAIQHDGDTYFSKSKLEAWKIWYRLDNDTTHFAWADATNGKGVIYRMIDEWNNDCPYDFKNIQFKRYKITKANQSDLVGTYLGLDESRNPESINVDNNDSKMFYTFSYLGALQELTEYEEKVLEDASIIGNTLESDINSPYGVLNNSIKPVINASSDGSDIIDINSTETIQILNNIVFLTSMGDDNFYYGCYNNSFESGCRYNSFESDCYANSFGNKCYSNFFGNGCSSNSFGNDCNYNSFGNSYSNNSFGDNCYSNSFGNNCNSNSFGNKCYSNSFGNDFSNNSFGNKCYSNSFKNGCYYNSFGNGCFNDSFGDNCYSNSFGNNCYSNSFGSGCSSNSFGNNCHSNSFGDNCYYNSFGNDCFNDSFGNDCSHNSFGNGCQYNKLNDYYTNNKFENKVTNIKFSGIGTDAVKVQNYHIKQGMTFTNSAPHTITAKTGLGYELTVAKQSDGTVVEYCEADLLKANNTSGIV